MNIRRFAVNVCIGKKNFACENVRTFSQAKFFTYANVSTYQLILRALSKL